MIYIAFILLTLLVFFIAFYQWQYFMIFTPTYKRDAQLVEHCEMLYVKTEDDVTLEGVVFNPPEAVATVLFFSGRSQDAVGLIKKISIYYPKVRIITFNYRSYGLSEGVASEKNILEDGLTIYEKVKKNYGELYVVGFSLGSSVAAYVGSKVECLGVMLLGSFDSLESIVKQKFAMSGLRLPFNVKKILRYKFDNIEYVKQIRSKVYLFSSIDDEITYIQNARNLQRNIANLELVREYEGLTHKDLLWHDDLTTTLNRVFDDRL